MVEGKKNKLRKEMHEMKNIGNLDKVMEEKMQTKNSKNFNTLEIKKAIVELQGQDNGLSNGQDSGVSYSNTARLRQCSQYYKLNQRIEKKAK